MFFPDHGGVQWLVVFLGNPGLKYQNTRHNAGFLTADVVEKDCGVHIDRLRKEKPAICGKKFFCALRQCLCNLPR